MAKDRMDMLELLREEEPDADLDFLREGPLGPGTSDGGGGGSGAVTAGATDAGATDVSARGPAVRPTARRHWSSKANGRHRQRHADRHERRSGGYGHMAN